MLVACRLVDGEFDRADAATGAAVGRAGMRHGLQPAARFGGGQLAQFSRRMEMVMAETPDAG